MVGKRTWRQDPVTHKMVEVTNEQGPAPRVHIRGDIEAFVSPVDGTVVGGRRQLRDHNRRNDVVNSQEFSPEFYAQKAAERADHYNGTTHTISGAKRSRELRQDIADTIRRMEHE